MEGGMARISISANMFGWLFVDGTPVTARQQHAFNELAGGDGIRAGAVEFKRHEDGPVWSASGAGGLYRVESRPGDPADAGEPMIIEATVEAGGGRVELYSWTAYPDEDDDADVAILKASILNSEAQAGGATLLTLLDEHPMATPVPEDLERARPEEKETADAGIDPF
jgi:hypothetical protein